jgi:signal transduction protein with GAF and PtsI domain
MMERIVQRAARVMEADRAYLFLLDTNTGDLYAKVTAGNESRIFRVQAGTEVVGLVAQTGEPLILQEAYLDKRFHPAIDIWTGHWTRTLMAGPVRDARGAIIAVIQVENKKKGLFNRDDEVLFRAFARQAATAVADCLPQKPMNSRE